MQEQEQPLCSEHYTLTSVCVCVCVCVYTVCLFFLRKTEGALASQKGALGTQKGDLAYFVGGGDVY